MALDFLKTAAMLIIFGALWRFTTAKLAASGGEAGRLASSMAFIY